MHLPTLGLEVCLRQLATDATDIVAVLVEDSRVIAMNDVAVSAGIMPGCSLATAVGICSELASFPRDANAEETRLHFLAEMALRFTSHVSLAEPDGLLLEVGRSLRLFGGLAALCEEVEALYRELGHELRLATADTPLAATVLARAGTSSLQAVPLACTHLDLGAIERFANMGVMRLGQVLALPAAELGQRFDPELLAYLDRLVGRVPDPQDLLVPTETFASVVHLVSSVQDGNALLFPVRRLAGELASWLASRRLGASEIIWTFTALHGEEASLAVRFARPRSDAGALFDHTRLSFEEFRPPSEVMSVSLKAESLRLLKTVTRPLLPEAPGAGIHADSAALELVDRLAARLGEDALHGIRMVDDHRPERAWGIRHVRQIHGKGGRPRQGTLPVRPIWLLPAPEPVRRGDFTLLGECERIETGWWDGAVARDYFVATARDGRQCWLFREERGDGKERWLLHGYFA
ncbi:MAG: DNA polymerase Y family protein [Gammaproteobacteria bacterium]|nr:DNA polymerase Y family protein [Gammaproteobacteria bacterium]